MNNLSINQKSTNNMKNIEISKSIEKFKFMVFYENERYHMKNTIHQRHPHFTIHRAHRKPNIQNMHIEEY